MVFIKERIEMTPSEITTSLINRRSLLLELTAVVLISLLIPSLAEPANSADMMPKGSARQDLGGHDEAPIFIVIPSDQGNETSFIPLSGAKQSLIGTALRKTDGGPAGIIFRHWMGFALKDGDSRSLRISIESVRPVEPTCIIKLLASNMTLDEIRNEIRMQEGNVTNRGVMRLDDDTYRLVDVKMVPSDNRTVLDANISQPSIASDHNITIIGHINVAFAREDTTEVSQGVLNMRAGKNKGNYKVLLDAQDAQDAPPHEHGMDNAGPPMMPPCR